MATGRCNSPIIRLAIFVITFVAILSTVESFILPSSKSKTTGRLHQRASVASSTYRSTTMVDDERMLNTYDSLASRLLDRYEKDAASQNNLRNNQLFVCIAGGPGSGKSTLSTAVARRINEKMQKKDGSDGNNDGEELHAVVLPMDGFHYSRSQLQSMGESAHIKYTFDELIARRGAPWTFDAEGCVAAFTDARQNGNASLPIYSRVKSDPVSDGAQLHPSTKIVLLEGNYLLAWDDERWAPLKTNRVFDETWYIACKSLEEQRERLVKRHLETWSEEKTKMFGEGTLGAGAKADSNDMLNLEWIEEMSRKHADYLIESV